MNKILYAFATVCLLGAGAFVAYALYQDSIDLIPASISFIVIAVFFILAGKSKVIQDVENELDERNKKLEKEEKNKKNSNKNID